MSRPLLRTLFVTPLCLVTIGCLAVTLAGFAGSWHWYLDLFNHLRPQYFIASLILLILLLVLRSKRWAMVAALTLALNALALAPHAIPLPVPAEPSGETRASAPRTLRVMTLNLLARNQNHAAVEAYLRREQPDIIAFQEVSAAWAAFLATLKDIYPYQHLESRSRGSFGLGILSRYPLSRSGLLWSKQPRELTGLEADFAAAGQAFSMLDIHAWHLTSAKGVPGVRALHDRIAAWSTERHKAGRSVIVLGDFNCTPWSVLFREFLGKSALTDTSRGRVFQATRHVYLPDQIMIDHIFVSPDLEVSSHKVGPDVGSDHRGVLVELGLTP